MLTTVSSVVVQDNPRESTKCPISQTARPEAAVGFGYQQPARAADGRPFDRVRNGLWQNPRGWQIMVGGNLRWRFRWPRYRFHVMSQSSNPAAPQQVAPLLALATKLLQAGRPADAIVPLRNAALLQPSNPIIQHDLGLACLEVGRIPDAIEALQRAVASNPRYADAFFRLGVALEKLGNLGGAIVAYDRATQLLPSLTEAWFRPRALVYTLGH